MTNLGFSIRQNTHAGWALDNPVLALGEPGYSTDLNEIKIGDGVKRWLDLPYNTGNSGSNRLGNHTLPRYLVGALASVTEKANTGTDKSFERARVDNIFSRMFAKPRGIALLRNNESYELFCAARSGYLRYGLPRVTGSGTDGPFGAGGVNMLREVDHVSTLTGVDYASAAAVETGAGWSNVTGPPQYRRTETIGDSSTYTTPANTTEVGLTITRHATCGGVMRVAINGDFTAARGLPTAQQLADAGRLDPVLLVGGGGTIDPTHRVYSSYATTTTPDVRLLLATGLSPGAYTVRVELVGYRSGASAGNRRGTIQQFAHAQTPLALSTQVWGGEPLSDVGGSAWEVATSFVPDGGASVFLGTYHGNHTQSSLEVYVDGVMTNPANLVIVPATESIRIVSKGTLIHPTGGYVADITTEYVLDAYGLTISPTTTWVKPGRSRAAYAMMPVTGPRKHGGFTNGTTSRNAELSVALPTGLNVDQDSSKSKASTAWLWSSRWVAMHSVLDWETWVAGGIDDRKTVIETRMGSTAASTNLAKVYNPRNKNDALGERIRPGMIHSYKARVMFALRTPGDDPSSW